MLESVLVFVAFSGLGIAAMAPAVTFGDSGEFAACAASWGLPHAPGYPFFVVCAKALGAAFPLGNWAYRTNLFSVAASAAALAVLCDAFRWAGSNRTARLGSLLCLGFVPVWRYSGAVTEVFALHSLVLCSLMWVVCRFAGRLWEDRPMAALGLAFGLGFANHQTVLLAVPAVLLESRLSSPAPARAIARGLAVAGLFAALGLCVYLCLPLRSAHGPPLDWGHPTNLARFLHVLLRKDYGSLSLTVEGQAAGGRLAQILRFFTDLRQLCRGGVLLALAFAGCWLWRSAGLRVSVWFPLVWLALTGPFFLWLGNPPFDAQTSGALERFELAPLLAAALLAVAALQAAGRRGGALALSLALAAAAPGAAAYASWWERGDLAAYDYGRGLMKSLPPGSALYMDGGDDTFYSLAFLDFAQGLRPDLELHDRGGLVFKNPYGWDFRALDAQGKENRRKAVESLAAAEGRLYYSTFKDRIVDGYDLQPWGLLKKARGTGSQPMGVDLWKLYAYRWDDARLAAHYRDRALIALYPTLRGAQRGAEAIFSLTQAWLMASDVLWFKPNAGYILGVLGYDASQRGDWSLAEKALRLARRVAPENGEALLNLGVVYEKTGRLAQAEQTYRKAADSPAQAAAAYYDLGSLYWGQKRWNDAAVAFEQALARKPGDPALESWARQARSKAR
ncbi:MAG: DUF2723 domain-containing protein [Elusimicrobia bacterium]|nr:DUF2723 domain-containing protein [Elusimicrobiota bacterium]